jgi:hypothetical protein
MWTRICSFRALGLLLLALLCAACTPFTPTPTPLASLDDLQTAPGHLNVALQAAESETFAGLWIENEPAFKVIVLFTRDGERTLRPYIAGTPLEGRVEVRQAKITLAELTAKGDEINQMLRDLALPFSTGVDVSKNQVIVYISDRVLWDDALRQKGLTLPDYVVANVIYEPLRGTPDFPITPVPAFFFPQLRARSATFMTALLQGRLVMVNGCLRVVTSYEPQGNLILWQPDYFPTLKDSGIEILNRDGQVVARAGEPISLGGGGVDLSENITRQLRVPIPSTCAGPYFLMGSIVSQPLLTPQPIPTETATPGPTASPTYATATQVPTFPPEPTATLPPARTATPVPTRTVIPAATSTLPVCSEAPDTALKVGDSAHVSVEQPFSNRVRRDPGIQSESLGQIQPGEIVKILAGPACADGYVWWLVRSLGGLEGWTAEGDAASDWIVLPIDAFTYDTVSQSAGSAVTLNLREKYRIILAGTYSLWISTQWTDLYVCIWGKSEPAPFLPSPGKVNGRVGLDPSVVFARPFYRDDCQDPNLVPAAERVSRIMISLDGGVDYAILSPQESGYRENHTYVYPVTGEGFPIRVRLDDAVMDDNYGQIFVMIEKVK